MAMSDVLLDAQRIQSRLATRRVGGVVRVFDELDSTNRYVLENANDLGDGAVVLTERQTKGRGRLGRDWRCPRGAGVLCTVCMIEDTSGMDANLLSLLVPVAICDAVRDSTDVFCEIKWPNDLMVGGRKLGGILIEGRSSGESRAVYAIGFGVNCLQQRGHFEADLATRATSLEMESSHPIDRTDILVRILTHLDRGLSDPGGWSPIDVCRNWKDRALPLGGRIRLLYDDRTFDGHVIDIDPTAALVVQLDQGGRRAFPAHATSVLDYQS